MNLSRYSAEDAFWTVMSDQNLIDAPQVAIGTQAVWYQAEWVDTVAAKVRTCRLLVAGPDAPVTRGAVVVPLDASRTWVRIPDGPKRVVREGARLFCS